LRHIQIGLVSLIQFVFDEYFRPYHTDAPLPSSNRDTELFNTKTARLHFALDQIMTESVHIGAAVFQQLYRPFLGNTLKYFDLSETYQGMVWFMAR